MLSFALLSSSLQSVLSHNFLGGVFMSNIVRHCVKFLLYFLFWVYFLSVPWGRKTLFQHAHAVLVENPPVQFLASEAEGFYDRLLISIRVKIAEASAIKEDSLQ